MEPASDPFLIALAGLPPWFRVESRSYDRVTGVAAIRLNAADATFVVALEITRVGRDVRARERDPGTVFPRCCFERHIESDGSFCLGIANRIRISDTPTALAWWERLEAYLRMQRTAGATGLWPEHHSLSHGDAGIHHQKALDHAAKAGLATEYENFVQGDPSFLAVLDRLLRKPQDLLVNGRCPCPCGRTGRGGKIVLRRNCPHRADVLALLREERMRKEKLADFVKTVKRSGMTCCDTMQACPMR